MPNRFNLKIFIYAFIRYKLKKKNHLRLINSYFGKAKPRISFPDGIFSREMRFSEMKFGKLMLSESKLSSKLYINRVVKKGKTFAHCHSDFFRGMIKDIVNRNT